MKRTLSFVLITVFALGIFMPAHAAVISSTQYVSTGCTQLTAPLSYGKYDSTTGGQVTALQNFLYAHGYLKVDPTGYFGPLTRSAVQTFQARAGITTDGIVGPQTRAFIFATDCGGNPVPPISAAPVITAISPSTATVGNIVTIYGSGFTSESIIHLSIGGIKPQTVGVNGSSISFTIPEYLGQYCKPNMACIAIAQMITNGTYPITVEQPNGAISNAMPLTIVGRPSPYPMLQ